MEPVVSTSYSVEMWLKVDSVSRTITKWQWQQTWRSVSIEDARGQIKRKVEHLKRGSRFDFTQIKFVIMKTISVETVEEELTGSDCTALMLKVA